MELRQLGYFVHVAETQSLSGAASVLRVAQSALSRQIKALEDELAVQLLVRHGWGVTPTAAGRVLLEHARQVLKQVGAARDAVRAFQSEPSGKLSFGVPTSLGLVLLPELAARFRGRAPKVQLHLAEGFSGTIHEWLLSGRLDLAVLYETRAMAGIHSQPLLAEEMMLIGPAAGAPAGPVALAQVAALSLVLPARPHRLRLLVDQAFADAGIDGAPAMEVDALPALVELVRMGGMHTLLPLSAVLDGVRAGALSATAVLPSIRRSLVLGRPQGRVPTPAAEALEAVVLEIVRERAATMNWEARCHAPGEVIA